MQCSAAAHGLNAAELGELSIVSAPNATGQIPVPDKYPASGSEWHTGIWKGCCCISEPTRAGTTAMLGERRKLPWECSHQF